MMDPITAFQVAGTVITFVEFSRTLLNDAREVYKSPSGATSQVVKLGSIADDLNTVGDHISTSLKSGPASSRTRSDERLADICERCTEMQNELQQALRGLQAKGDTKFDFAISSLATAFRSIWSQSKINDLDRRLREVQSEMTMAVLMSLWEDERIHGRSRQESLDAVVASVNKTDRKLDQLMQNLLQTSSYTSSNGTSERSMLFRELWKADWRPDRDQTQEFENISSDEVASFIQQNIINSLWFRSIESRDKAISETYESTYEWILDPNGSTGFTTWMEEDQSLLYWITGKAGSGKSTLMKYLVHHQSTTQHLKKWSGDMPLLFCHFYFWEATTEELQHSREGLTRTLLWQCLEKNPELVRKVSPRRWAAYLALRGWEGPVPEWSWEELQETFQNLASLNNSNFKLVMFIDGLDEFDGDPATLIQWIKDVTTRFRVKLCVGSRPWTAFSDAFDQYPTLTMQTLTAPDIQTYIIGHFNTSRAFRDWQALSPNGTEALRHDLFEKADGVFLWVYVVVKELMSALEKGRNIQDLSVILDSLPTDMMNLYTNIYGAADPDEAKRAAVYFTLLQAAIHTLEPYELWYIEETSPVDPRDTEAWVSMQRVIKRRLDSSTRGMVEVSRDGFVIFHHRSVFQWLLLPDVVPVISSRLPEHFDARLLLMKGRRAGLAQVWQSSTYSETARSKEWALYYKGLYEILYYASLVAESPVLTPALLRELEIARDTLGLIATSINRPDFLFFVQRLARVNPSLPQWLKGILPTHTRYRGKHKHSATDMIKVDEYETGHWSLPQNWGRVSTQSCFTVLAAHFAVYPYVMAQVKESPDLLEEKNDRMSLLHSAIFGPRLDNHTREIPSVDYQLRLRLIQALLDSGAPVRGRMHDRRTGDDRDIYYLDAIDRTHGGLLESVGPKEYWDEVKRLLTMKMTKGARFRRSLRAMVEMSDQ